MARRKGTVTLDAGTFDFYVAEAEAIHALMDVAEIPKEFDGQKLSMSQRVSIYTKTTETRYGAILKASGCAAH